MTNCKTAGGNYSDIIFPVKRKKKERRARRYRKREDYSGVHKTVVVKYPPRVIRGTTDYNSDNERRKNEFAAVRSFKQAQRGDHDDLANRADNINDFGN